MNIDADRCIRCGATLDPDQDECPQCGHTFSLAEVMGGARPCHYCKEPVFPNALYCSNCEREDPLRERRRFRRHALIANVFKPRFLFVVGVVVVSVWLLWG